MKTTTRHYDKITKVLGKHYVSSRIESPYDFIPLASKGIKASVIKNFTTYFNISNKDTADMLNISSLTLSRWIKSDKRLERNYSILLFELTDLFLYGIDVFDGKESFLTWLGLPNKALGKMEPQELLEMPGGIAKVRDLIGRIEHGIYS